MRDEFQKMYFSKSDERDQLILVACAKRHEVDMTALEDDDKRIMEAGKDYLQEVKKRFKNIMGTPDPFTLFPQITKLFEFENPSDFNIEEVKRMMEGTSCIYWGGIHLHG